MVKHVELDLRDINLTDMQRQRIIGHVKNVVVLFNTSHDISIDDFSFQLSLKLCNDLGILISVYAYIHEADPVKGDYISITLHSVHRNRDDITIEVIE